MNFKKIALSIVIIFCLVLLSHRMNPVRQGAESPPPATPPGPHLTPKPPPAAQTYQDRELEAVREEKDIASVSARQPQGFEQRLKLFRKYSHKVLKTEAEVELLHKLLADGPTQDAALAALNPTTEENERMVVVDYLMTGLDEFKTSTQNQLHKKVIQFLQSEVPPDLDNKMIRSLAADRIELFVMLRQLDHKAAEELIANANSNLNKRIYQYAVMNYGKKGT